MRLFRPLQHAFDLLLSAALHRIGDILEQHGETYNKRCDSEQEQQPPSEVAGIRDAVESIAKSQKAAHDPKKLYKDRPLVVSIVGVGVVLIYTTVTFFILLANNRQLSILEAADRPFVGVASMVPTELPDGSATVLATLKNFGHSPATEFSAKWRIFVDGVEKHGAVREPESDVIVFPNADQALSATFPAYLWSGISSGANTLEITVRTTYTWDYGKRKYGDCERRKYTPAVKMFMILGKCD